MARAAKDPIVALLLIGFHHERGMIYVLVILYCLYTAQNIEFDGVRPSHFANVAFAFGWALLILVEASFNLEGVILVGNEVEWMHPASNELSDEFKKEVIFLALPDQAHQKTKDFVYFQLSNYYCVACFQQIPTSSLKNKSEDMTRSSVQKAVCVVSRLAFYGWIKELIDPVTQAYFIQGDFTDKTILEGCFEKVSRSVQTAPVAPSLTAPTPPAHRLSPWAPGKATPNDGIDVYWGIDISEFIVKYGRATLQLFKLLLLQPRIAFYGSPSEVVEGVLALLSLLPHTLPRMCNLVGVKPTAEHLYRDTLNLAKREDLATTKAPPTPTKPATPTDASAPTPEKPTSVITSYTFSEPTTEAEATLGTEEKKPEALDTQAQETRLLLQQYVSGYLPWLDPLASSYVSPYVSLQQLDPLTIAPSYVIGTSNTLFALNKHLLPMDVLVDVNSSQVEIRNLKFEGLLALSTADKAFIENIIGAVSKAKFQAKSEYLGSDSWVRHSFEQYLIAMLSAMTDYGYQHTKLGTWNADFLAEWCQSSHFKAYRDFISASLLPEGSPYSAHDWHPGSELATKSTIFNGLRKMGESFAVNNAGLVEKANAGISEFTSKVSKLFETSFAVTPAQSPSAAAKPKPAPATNAEGQAHGELIWSTEDQDLADEKSWLISEIEEPAPEPETAIGSFKQAVGSWFASFTGGEVKPK